MSRSVKRKHKATSEKQTDSVFDLSRMFLLITVFITGAAIMIVELMGSRVLGPYYGVSIFVWASLIATALIGLSVGYWIGGRVSDARTHPDYLYASLFAAAILICFIPVLRRPVILLTAGLGLRFGSLMSSFMLFLLPITLLGIVSPFAVRLGTRSLVSLGSTAGTLYAVSTVGSVLGTLMTGFLFIPMVPMDTVLYCAGLCLAVVVFIYALLRRRFEYITASSILLLIVVTMAGLSPDMGSRVLPRGYRIVHSAETPYGQLKVMEAGGARYMLINGSFQGEIDVKTGLSRSSYIHAMTGAAAGYGPGSGDALVIGLGTGALQPFLKELGYHVDSVEIDPEVVYAAERYFGFDPGHGKVFQEDARYYLEITEHLYDIICFDAFGSEAVPSHLLSREVFMRCADLMTDSGIIVLNVLGFRYGEESRAIKAIIRTIQSVFPFYHIWWINDPGEDRTFGNFIVTASMFELPVQDPHTIMEEIPGIPEQSIETVHEAEWTDPGDGGIISDMFNPLFAWNEPTDRIIRERIIRFVPPEILL